MKGGRKQNDILLRQTGRSVGKIGTKKMGSSVSNFGGTNRDGTSLKSGSVRDPKEDEYDLEDFGDIMESIQL